MKNMTRRDLMAWFGVSGLGIMVHNPYHYFFQILKNGLIQQAHAQSIGQSAKNYIVFLQYGAPPRWCWDGFLNPTGISSEMVANGCVKNYITSAQQKYNGDRLAMDYRQSNVYNYQKNGLNKQIYMPALWDVALPRHNGTTAVIDAQSPLMRSLLNNALIIRGVNMGVDIGHERGPELVLRPSPSRNSITGSVAELNQGVIPAVGMTGSALPYLGYKSLKQVSMAVTRGGTNGPLFDLFEPFVTTQTGTYIGTNKANELLMESAMNVALQEMKDYAAARRPGSEVLFDTVRSSEEMFKEVSSKLLNLPTVFTTLKNRYRDLNAQSKQAVPGLIPPPADLTSQTDLFSDGFAVAEFMIMNGFSSSCTFDAQKGMNIGNFFDDTNMSRSIGYHNDEHQYGDRQHIAATCHFTYRSFMACLNLFKERIGATKWNNTVVQLSSEYGRTPRNDGTGSDHSPGSNVITVFSGSIKQYIPIGNIYKDKAGENVGTFGLAAPTSIAGLSAPVIITKEIAANTIASLVGVQPIIETAPTLIETDPTNGWKSKTEDPKNV